MSNLSINGTIAALVLALAASVGGGEPAAAAENCLSQPNRQSKPGEHWYYRIDRPTQRRCWYLKGAEVRAPNAAATADAAAPRREPEQQPNIVSWLSAMIEPARPGAAAEPAASAATTDTTPEAALRRRALPTRRAAARPAPGKPPAPASTPAPTQAAPKAEGTTSAFFDDAHGEALFQEFLLWRQRQLLAQ